MKNKKMKLEELKVQSFVTDVTSKDKLTIAGGAPGHIYSDNAGGNNGCGESVGVGCTDANCFCTEPDCMEPYYLPHYEDACNMEDIWYM